MAEEQNAAPPCTDDDCEYVRKLFLRATGVAVKVRIENGQFVVTDPNGDDCNTGLVRKQ